MEPSVETKIIKIIKNNKNNKKQLKYYYKYTTLQLFYFDLI